MNLNALKPGMKLRALVTDEQFVAQGHQCWHEGDEFEVYSVGQSLVIDCRDSQRGAGPHHLFNTKSATELEIVE